MKFYLALVLMIVGHKTSVWAGTFSVNPVRIELSANRPNTILQVTNEQDDETTFQVRVLTWNTDGKNDVFADSNEILVNPPIAVLGPRQKQYVRIGLRHPKDETAELAYRIIVEEVPKAPRPGFSGIQTLLRISIPIFILPKTSVAPMLTWEMVKTDAAGLKLVATNHGNAHIQIRTLDIAGDGAQAKHMNVTTPSYLLPNAQHEWLIDPEKIQASGPIKVVATTDAGLLHEMVEAKH